MVIMMYSADFLLRLLKGVDIPTNFEADDGNTSAKCFDLGQGWTVWIFYDVGELDYIEFFGDPTGEKIDFWEWPASEERDKLTAWRGNDQ